MNRRYGGRKENAHTMVKTVRWNNTASLSLSQLAEYLEEEVFYDFAIRFVNLVYAKIKFVYMYRVVKFGIVRLLFNYVTLQINRKMQTLNIYKEIQPTYGEWLPILEDLGYQKQVIDFISISKQKKQQYRLENPHYNSIILLPFLSDNEPVLKAHFASYSHLLHLQGVIEDEQDMAKKIENRRLHRAEEDLIKMVEKNRLKKNKSANLSNRI